MNEEFYKEKERLGVFESYAKQYLYDNVSVFKQNVDLKDVVDDLYQEDNCVATEIAQNIERSLGKLEKLRKKS